MLIATGVLIGIVLAVMTGVTVQNLQGLGWIPTTPMGIDLSLTWGRWLGVYPNWEGVGAQLARAARRLRLLRARPRHATAPPAPGDPAGRAAGRRRCGRLVAHSSASATLV